jgi:hypothetical protein
MSSLKSAIARLALAGAMSLAALTPTAMAENPLEVTVGFSEILRPSEIVNTIIIGDDKIANVTTEDGVRIIVTALSVGFTNLIFLNRTGEEVYSSVVEVVPVDRRPLANVQMIIGGADETRLEYGCGPAPGCAPAQAEDNKVTTYTTVIDGTAAGIGGRTTTVERATE